MASTLPSFESAFVPGGSFGCDRIEKNPAENEMSFFPSTTTTTQCETYRDWAKIDADDLDSDSSSNISSVTSTLVDFFSDPNSPHSSSSISSYCSEDEGVADLNIGKVKKTSAKRTKKTYQCSKCDKNCHNPSQLEEHFLYRHSDLRTHQCEHCPKVFKTKSNLKQHLRTHQGATRRCPECDKWFTESGFRYHVLSTHAKPDSRRFQCQMCPKSFVQNKLLQKHIATLHSTERKFACPHCPHTFKRKDHMRRHISDTHDPSRPREFECSECKAKFHSQRKLSGHKRTHRNVQKTSFQCQICAKTFASERKRLSHEKTRHEEKLSQLDWLEDAFLDEEDLNLSHFGDSVNDSTLNAFIHMFLQEGDGKEVNLLM